MDKKERRPFPEAKKIVRRLGLKNQKEWKKWAKSGERPPDIPSNPNRSYAEEWKDWGDWLGTGNVYRKPVEPFKEARDFAWGLRLKSKTEWTEWAKSDERPPSIPSNPNVAYPEEWKDWGDWLGNAWVKAERHRPFKEARDFARGLQLKSSTEWKEWVKSGAKPSDIPSKPEIVYSEEWKDWPDWLGTNTRAFEQARDFAQSLGLKNMSEWREWVKSGAKPSDIPSKPDYVYRGEWKDWGDWLGTGNVWRGFGKPVRPFKEAREFARGLQLKNAREWREWLRSNDLPKDMPVAPEQTYKEDWRGWGDWLGVVNLWTRAALLSLLEDLRPQLPYLEERELYAILSQGGAMPALVRNFGKGSPQEVIKDLKENDGRGVEEAAKAGDDVEVAVTEEAYDVAVSEDVAEALDHDADISPATEKPPEEEDPEAGLPSLVTKGGLRTVDALASRPCGLDDDTAEYLVSNRVAGLWDALVNGHADPISDVRTGEGGHYLNLIRSRFESELEAVENLPVPEGWSFTENGSGKVSPPLPMQKRTAWAVLNRKRVGNWSGAGAGKTNAAILASRVSGCANTLVVCNNATVEGWRDAIKNAFPDSIVHMKPSAPVPSAFNYTVLNYEKFQQPNRGRLVHQLRDLGYDFVVLDEVQLTKQRDGLKSNRRETLEALVYQLAKENPELRVLGMSATPVINNLYEGRKLLEIVTGRSFGDLEHKATVPNALAVHRALMVHGFRYKPQYDIEFGKPELVETIRNDLLDDLRAASGVLRVEQVLLPAKLEAIRDHVRPSTLIYTHYVDGIVYPARRFLERLGYRVGVYTGEDKTGLEDFKAERVDVLIGSQPVATGVDGLQTVCDRIVVLSPPWTGAEYEQLLGRVYRQGSAFERIEVIWPQVVLDHHGEQWSWDARRQRVIEYKRTLSDCAVDGNLPEALSISPTTLLRRSREALEEWIQRIEENDFAGAERPGLEVPLPPELRERARVKYGDFTTMNNRWSTSTSTTVYERLTEDPSEWYLYHTYYREARAKWEEIPAEHIASQLRARPDLRIGDFGCGECLLRDALTEHDVVGLDYVALDESVIACDMAHTPLEDGSLGAAVFSLSLMGRNWSEYLAEAHRTLQPLGFLFVAEPAKRWAQGKLEKAVEEAGFSIMESSQRGRFRYATAVKNRL